MKAGLVAFICAPLAAAVSPDVLVKFDEFVKTFSRSYGSDEERSSRLRTFAENLVEVEKLRLLEEGSASYSHLTPFADLTSEEFSVRNGFAADQAVTADAVAEVYDTVALPDSFDWRDQGAVNPIKDQKQCGSCWAFATVANIEGAGFVENKKLLSLSEQELVDCDHSGDQGCQGGLPSNAYKFLIKSKSGLELETAYPYKAKNGKKCLATTSAEKAFVGGWKQISTDEDQIAAALMQYGPLAIGINAGPMQLYSGGVAHPSKSSCNPKQLDHGVAIVGFGAESGKKYWVIRNSWGKTWGESGYYRIVRGAGACGLNTMVTTATQITDNSVERKFHEFQTKYSKEYTVQEKIQRLAVFAENLVQMEQLQALEAGTASYSHLTPFADISMEDFSARNGFQAGLEDLSGVPVGPALEVAGLPDSFDWREKGAVNAVKDQKQCGSCWAFATVANIEGAGFVANQKLLSLSEQELVDCDHSGDQGCQGGLPSNAYKFLIAGKTGLEAESVYPYKAKNGQCQAKASAEKAFIGGWQSISTDEDQIGAALTQYGPLAIGINASPMQMYSGGIAHPSKLTCNPKKLDHGVAIVGFGAESDKKYWVIRNSWGKTWGESGYYRIVRGAGACGLNTMVTTATGITLNSAVVV